MDEFKNIGDAPAKSTRKAQSFFAPGLRVRFCMDKRRDLSFLEKSSLISEKGSTHDY
ncbi:MAG: hypothetical protein KGY42_08485 [Desulfobacterales bacterium]|nr:hypothetical protein [Desulfobacterales bacterium]MBS3754888.1 hypothetical protein [Desulfobacterales bacterium]